MQCPACEKGRLVRKKVEYSYQDWHFGRYDADVCCRCGEMFFTERASRAIEQKAKEIGVWGIERKTKIARSGNSLIVRVPKRLAAFLQINEGDDAVIRPDGKKKFTIIAE